MKERYRLLKDLPDHEIGEIWNEFKDGVSIEHFKPKYSQHTSYWEYGFFTQFKNNPNWFEKLEDEEPKRCECREISPHFSVPHSCKYCSKTWKTDGDTVAPICFNQDRVEETKKIEKLDLKRFLSRRWGNDPENDYYYLQESIALIMDVINSKL